MIAGLDAWVSAEVHRLETTSPALARGLRTVLTNAAVLSLLLYVAASVAIQAAVGPGADSSLFDAAGRQLLSSDGLDVFSDPTVQSGPLFLLLAGLGSYASEALGVADWVGPSALTALVAASLALLLGRQLGLGSGPLLVFGLTAAVGLSASLAHPDDLLVALLVMNAAADGVLGRSTRFGALLGLAVAIKLWAVLALGLLLRRGVRHVRSGLVAAVVILVAYLPFYALGHVSTGSFSWQVEDPAPLRFMLEQGHAFPYTLRLLQAAVAGSIGIAVVLRARDRDLPWLFPLAIVAARVLLDPRWIPYYWAPVLLSLALATLVVPRVGLGTRLLVLLLWSIPFELVLIGLPDLPSRAFSALTCVAVLVGVARTLRKNGTVGHTA